MKIAKRLALILKLYYKQVLMLIGLIVVLFAIYLRFLVRDGGIAYSHLLHSQGVDIGREEGTLSDLLQKCTLDMRGGCVHGVVMGYGTRHSLSSDIARRSCDDVPYLYNLDCAHGVGHYVQLLSGSLNRKLSVCDEFSSNDEQQSCGGGVFMEAYGFIGHGHQNEPLDCSSVPMKYKLNCVFQKSKVEFMNDFPLIQEKSDVFNRCSRYSGELRTTCESGIIDALLIEYQGNRVKVGELCLLSGNLSCLSQINELISKYAY